MYENPGGDIVFTRYLGNRNQKSKAFLANMDPLTLYYQFKALSKIAPEIGVHFR